MVKGPGLYSDIGKKARDLLYKDYNSDLKFTLTTYSSTGVLLGQHRDSMDSDAYGPRYYGPSHSAAHHTLQHSVLYVHYVAMDAVAVKDSSLEAIASTGTKKGEFYLADINTQLKNKNVTTDIKVDTSSKLHTTITVDEPAPGLKAIFSFIVPDQKSGKVELQYMHEYAGINTSIGLTASPLVNFAGVIGTNNVALGADLAFDSATGNFTKYNAALSYSNSDLIASLTLTDKGDLERFLLPHRQPSNKHCSGSGAFSRHLQQCEHPDNRCSACGRPTNTGEDPVEQLWQS